MERFFTRVATSISSAAGQPLAFILAVLIIVVWGVTGPVFHFSDTWQLVVNTGTTIITFLMVFIIQNTQTRDSRELHVKLDELLRAVAQARNRVILSEELTDEELERLQAELRSTALLDRRRQRRARESVSAPKDKEEP